MAGGLGGAQRVMVVGTSCSGKTTLAKELAARLGVAHLDCDAEWWLPGWRKRELDDFRERIARRVAADGGVSCGNFSSVRDLTWPRAQVAVWLDYPLATVLGRWATRSIRRTITSERCCNGNTDRIWRHFVGREGLFWWILATHRKHRREYPAAFAAHPHLRVVRLRSPRETEAWLATC